MLYRVLPFIQENDFNLQEGISLLILQDHLPKTIKEYILGATLEKCKIFSAKLCSMDKENKFGNLPQVHPILINMGSC